MYFLQRLNNKPPLPRRKKKKKKSDLEGEERIDRSAGLATKGRVRSV